MKIINLMTQMVHPHLCWAQFLCSGFRGGRGGDRGRPQVDRGQNNYRDQGTNSFSLQYRTYFTDISYFTGRSGYQDRGRHDGGRGGRYGGRRDNRGPPMQYDNFPEPSEGKYWQTLSNFPYITRSWYI